MYKIYKFETGLRLDVIEFGSGDLAVLVVPALNTPFIAVGIRRTGGEYVEPGTVLGKTSLEEMRPNIAIGFNNEAAIDQMIVNLEKLKAQSFNNFTKETND